MFITTHTRYTLYEGSDDVLISMSNTWAQLKVSTKQIQTQI